MFERIIAQQTRAMSLPMFYKISLELQEIINKGVLYNNPKFWKKIYAPISINRFSLKSSFKFNDKEVGENFKELMDYLCSGKELTQDHVDFVSGKGIFADNYDGLKKDIDRYIEHIQNKKE